MQRAFAQAISTADVPDAGKNIAAISVAGQQHGMVVLDARNDVLRPAKLWNDTESSIDSTALRSALSDEAWARACGSVPLAAFTITKLAWLKREEPTAFDKVAKVLLPHDWINFKLTHEFTTDRGDASGTGYWSPRSNEYDFGLLALVDSHRDWNSLLPTVRGPRDLAGHLEREAAEALGVRTGIPVSVGTGDNMAGALGLGQRPGDVAISIGSSGTIFATSDQLACDPSGAVAGFADATGRYLPLVCVLNATFVTDAVARLLTLTPSAASDLALTAPLGSRGLTLVPYFSGERTPNEPDASGVLSGLRSNVTREDLARAAFEGVACGLLEGLDTLVSLGPFVESPVIVLIGGGSRSPAFRDVLATLASKPVVIPHDLEVVSTGASLQAASIATGTDFDEISEAWGLRGGDVVEPRYSVESVSEVRRRYADARELAIRYATP